MSREAMELALRALDNYMSLPAPAKKAITALREALAEQPVQQEPTAWMSGWSFDELRERSTVMATLTKQKIFEDDIAFYTTPPQRTWVELTDEEIIECEEIAGKNFRRHHSSARGQMITPADGFNWHLAQVVQNKLKEKNT